MYNTSNNGRKRIPASKSNRNKHLDSNLLKDLSSGTIKVIGNYQLGGIIGEGSFGKVKEATHLLTNCKVAIKIVDKTHAPTVVREIEMWKRLKHPHIAQLYEVLNTENKIFMVMEHSANGEIFDYLMNERRLSDAEGKRLFLQLVEAVSFCHENHCVHRDLKLENILLDEEMNVKLIDFGFTRELESPEMMLETFCGSVAYAAPEMITGKKYTGPEADIWSLGVILYTLMVGFLPFDEENEQVLQTKIMSLDYEFPKEVDLDPMLRDLIHQMLQLDPTARCSIQQMKAHPWLLPQVSAVSISAANEVDMQIVGSLSILGIDTKALIESLRDHELSSATALYYLIRHKRLEQERKSRDLMGSKVLKETNEEDLEEENEPEVDGEEEGIEIDEEEEGEDEADQEQMDIQTEEKSTSNTSGVFFKVDPNGGRKLPSMPNLTQRKLSIGGGNFLGFMNGAGNSSGGSNSKTAPVRSMFGKSKRRASLEETGSKNRFDESNQAGGKGGGGNGRILLVQRLMKSSTSSNSSSMGPKTISEEEEEEEEEQREEEESRRSDRGIRGNERRNLIQQEERNIDATSRSTALRAQAFQLKQPSSNLVNTNSINGVLAMSSSSEEISSGDLSDSSFTKPKTATEQVNSSLSIEIAKESENKDEDKVESIGAVSKEPENVKFDDFDNEEIESEEIEEAQISIQEMTIAGPKKTLNNSLRLIPSSYSNPNINFLSAGSSTGSSGLMRGTSPPPGSFLLGTAGANAGKSANLGGALIPNSAILSRTNSSASDFLDTPSSNLTSINGSLNTLVYSATPSNQLANSFINNSNVSSSNGTVSFVYTLDNTRRLSNASSNNNQKASNSNASNAVTSTSTISSNLALTSVRAVSLKAPKELLLEFVRICNLLGIRYKKHRFKFFCQAHLKNANVSAPGGNDSSCENSPTGQVKLLATPKSATFAPFPSQSTAANSHLGWVIERRRSDSSLPISTMKRKLSHYINANGSKTASKATGEGKSTQLLQVVVDLKSFTPSKNGTSSISISSNHHPSADHRTTTDLHSTNHHSNHPFSEIIRFEMEIIRTTSLAANSAVNGVSIGSNDLAAGKSYGLKFRRICGEQWHYKQLCDQIVNSMSL